VSSASCVQLRGLARLIRSARRHSPLSTSTEVSVGSGALRWRSLRPLYSRCQACLCIRSRCGDGAGLSRCLTCIRATASLQRHLACAPPISRLRLHLSHADLGLPRGRTRAKSACDACAHEDARWPRMQAGQAYVADETRMIVDGLME
jgi:hypothetical protein